MSLMETLVARAKAATKTIILPEGQDPRVMKAAQQIAEQNIADVILLANEAEVADAGEGVSFEGLNVKVVDHLNSPEFEMLAAKLQERRAKRGMDMEAARKAVSNRIYYGAMMVSEGLADGLVAGSIASTGDMLRAAFHCIGTAPGFSTASSCFLMELAQPAPCGAEVLAFGDCAVLPDPTAEQLADIAIASAQTRNAIIGGDQKIGMLSFSTKGSADNHQTQKVCAATKLVAKQIEERGLPFMVDGELQLDAAIVPAVGAKKAPGSDVAGQANVLIFPDLQAGNIGYKLVERLAGANAFGPIVQGLAKPLNDLSRGCSVEDIVAVSAITVCQALG